MITIVIKTNNLASRDSTVIMPDEIHIDSRGVIARYAAYGDVKFDGVSEFAKAYDLDDDSIFESDCLKNLTEVQNSGPVLATVKS